jgi:cytoplasmic tRNA 2-thiolation protein 1
VTSTPSASSDPASTTNIKRSKPLKYAYEKEIVLYAHHKNLDYFSTECIYSPEAFRGSARALIKNLERVRPSAILDVVRSGEDMARLVPGSDENCGGACATTIPLAEEEEGGCGSSAGRTVGADMVHMSQHLSQPDTTALEVEITRKSLAKAKNGKKPAPPRKTNKQVMGQCRICGYLSSQDVCKACVLLEGLNKARPRNNIEVAYEAQDTPHRDQAADGVAGALQRTTMGGD